MYRGLSDAPSAPAMEGCLGGSTWTCDLRLQGRPADFALQQMGNTTACRTQSFKIRSDDILRRYG